MEENYVKRLGQNRSHSFQERQLAGYVKRSFGWVERLIGNDERYKVWKKKILTFFGAFSGVSFRK